MPIKIRIEYRKYLVASDLPIGQVVLDLALTLEYTQSNVTTSAVTNNDVLKLVANGSIENIGTVVTIGSEDDNIKLLSMHNLMVGNEGNILEEGKSIVIILSNLTSLQSSDATGAKFDSDGNLSFLSIGTVAFATEEKHGTN